MTPPPTYEELERLGPEAWEEWERSLPPTTWRDAVGVGVPTVLALLGLVLVVLSNYWPDYLLWQFRGQALIALSMAVNLVSRWVL